MLQRVSPDTMYGVAGARLADSVVVRVLGADGGPIANARVSFANVSGGGAFSPTSALTDAAGFARTVWVLGGTGPQEAVASTEGATSTHLHARVVSAPPAVTAMLAIMSDYLPWAANRLRELRPGNPLLVSYIDAKLHLLETPGLGSQVVAGGRYTEGAMMSRSGQTVPITAVFPLESMRGEAVQSVALLTSALPVVEEFLGVAYPWQSIHVWDGFLIGSSNSAWVSLEDRATYETRAAGKNLVPYDAIVVHEATHTWMPHESLNQFLELYGYNVIRTGSADAARWTHTRDWVPGRAENTGIHALLDIYQLAGPTAMAAGYRAILPMRVPYGGPIPQPAQEAFAAAMPEPIRPQVAAKLANVGF
ncbi:MAG TPA: Ig-like domain-containing protein [Longimicrobiaceae bacterium]|nr:Ig-like domain-containing protein [Longimicrobiaceae bacterium]